MSNLPNNSEGTSPVFAIRTQWKNSLCEFFQQKSVKNLVSVLVPSALAAVLFPVFGPAVAGAAAVVAVKNGLDALHISLSTETIGKILKPLEGKAIEEDDIKEVLDDLLKKDEKVNEEASKVVVSTVPELKEAVSVNPRLDQQWLAQSLEVSLKEQGGTMALLAARMRQLTILEGDDLDQAIAKIQAEWPRLIQSMKVNVSGDVEASDFEQRAHGHSGDFAQEQQITGSEHAKLKGFRQEFTQN